MEKQFIVETSARHIHVTAETFAVLFGKDATLHNKKDLSQPGQFACEEKVTLVGPKGELKVSILGPFRKADQVELSFTDARALGLKAVPVRESGDVAGTPGLKLVGPAGEMEMPNFFRRQLRLKMLARKAKMQEETKEKGKDQ